MAITNPDYIYVAKYDIYVSRSDRTFWKRCNRNRKTEITDDELVLMDKFTYTTNGYIQTQLRVPGEPRKRGIGIYYVFAEAYPELVGNADLHAKYPYLYNELNHKSHKTEGWSDNYPENLEWLPTSINRADTSVNVEKNNPDEKRLRASRYMKDWYQKKKQDPEWLEKFRKKSAESQRKRYYRFREQRKQQELDLTAQLQTVAGLRKQQADEKHQLAD